MHVKKIQVYYAIARNTNYFKIKKNRTHTYGVYLVRLKTHDNLNLKTKHIIQV